MGRSKAEGLTYTCDVLGIDRWGFRSSECLETERSRGAGSPNLVKMKGLHVKMLVKINLTVNDPFTVCRSSIFQHWISSDSSYVDILRIGPSLRTETNMKQEGDPKKGCIKRYATYIS